MDQITVSDIPLPGEEVYKDSDDSAKQTEQIPESKLETAEQTNNTEAKLEIVDSTTESDNTTAVTENSAESATEVKEPTETVNETEKLAEEILQEVTESESVQVECVTNEVITETVQELQMEIEAAVSADSADSVQSDVSTVILESSQEVDESMEPLRCDDSVDQIQEISQQKDDETMETTTVDQIQEVEQQKDDEPMETSIRDDSVQIQEPEEQPIEEKIEDNAPTVEEPPTPAVQQENKTDKPAKKSSRTNSTIEAIKNDWLTIEEVSDEVESSSPNPEPIITEPETKPDNNIEKNDTEPKKEPEITATIELIDNNDAESETAEIVEEKPVVTETAPTEEATQVVVLETVHDEIIGTVAENVTIEIIDHNVNNDVEQPPVETVADKPQKPDDDKDKVVILVEEVEQKTEQPIKKTPRPRGRPPSKSNVQRSDNLQIPCHVLGRNIDNPTEDLISNGRTPPKPRLGVKVPYRFLTSQIVTKEEIAHELLEITDKRNPAPDLPAGGDIFFASKLTQRLASKIALNAVKKKEPEATSGIPNDALTSATTSTNDNSVEKHQKSIGDNSDLLAILEGDVDVDWTKDIRNTKPTEVEAKPEEPTGNTRKLDPITERQIALKQLREMPKKEGRGRPRKYFYDTRPQRIVKVESPKKEKIVEAPKLPEPSKQIISNETNEDIKQAVNKLASKIKENVTNAAETVEPDLNLTPRRVTKTYSRKETVVDIPDDLEFIVNELEPAPSALDSKTSETKKPADKDKKPEMKKTKRSLPETVNKPEITLVSKRARIIKKKVIWDPAEVPKTRVLNAIRKAQQLELKARKLKMKQKPEQTNDKDESDDEEEEVEDNKPIKQIKQEQKNKSGKQEVKRPLRKLIQRPQLSKIQKKKLLISRPLRFVRSSNGELKSSLALSKKKKQMMTEIAKSVRNKPKKTELDKLLGDEGAVNMLYSVKQRRGRPSKKTIVSQRELQNRQKVLRETITQISSQEDSTKALRKKELPVRKKSRDSVRSSLQSPPPSPSFFHPQRAEASRIIRRHSSSFSSDCSSPRRLSVDTTAAAAAEEVAKNGDFQSPGRVLRKKDVKPEDKTVKKTDKVVEKLTNAEKRKLNTEMSKNFDKTPKKRTRSSKGEPEDEPKPETEDHKQKSDYKEIILKKTNHFHQIIMSTPTNSKLRDVISLQMFQELTSVITKLAKDESCKVLCLTSKGKSFCNGLDVSHLIQTTAEKRSSAAQDMSRAVKEFILSLARFPKPFICCLSSSSSLLGVTMLPYFDVVLAADTATLCADYSRLGHSPEGAPQLTMTDRTARELLILGKKISAKNAVDLGLITFVEPADKLEDRLVKIAEEFGGKSLQSLVATKSLLRQPLLQKLVEALDFEQKLLVELWPSVECQQHFKKLLTEQELW